MSKYNFNIDNYHAIGHADIEIEGITVIVGSMTFPDFSRHFFTLLTKKVDTINFIKLK